MMKAISDLKMGFYNGKEKTSSSERQFDRSHAGDKLRPTPTTMITSGLPSTVFIKDMPALLTLPSFLTLSDLRTMPPSWDSMDSRRRHTTLEGWRKRVALMPPLPRRSKSA